MTEEYLPDPGGVQLAAPPRPGLLAYAGPALAIAMLAAILVGPVAVAVVAGGAAAIGGIDLLRALHAREILVPKILLLVLAGLLPVAALKGVGGLAVGTAGALVVLLVWGLPRVKDPGLADSLAGSALGFCLLGFGLAHATLIRSGEFAGGPGGGKALALDVLFLIVVNQAVAAVFAAATVSIVRTGGSGAVQGAIATMVVAIIEMTIRRPPVGWWHFLVLGAIVSGAGIVGRLVTALLIEGATDPDEIADHAAIGMGASLRAVEAAIFAYPAAYYVGRWLFV